jgi:hypothetical protein
MARSIYRNLFVFGVHDGAVSQRIASAGDGWLVSSLTHQVHPIRRD